MIFYLAKGFKNKEVTVKVDQGCALMTKIYGKQELSSTSLIPDKHNQI